MNGDPVDAQILKPGWTPYQFRLMHETTDITALLREGKNAIGASHRGRVVHGALWLPGPSEPLYGDQPSFAAQIVLEYDNGSRVSTRDRRELARERGWSDAVERHLCRGVLRRQPASSGLVER